MPSQELVATFLRLREHCEWIQTCFNTNKELFGSGVVRQEIMQRVAPAFFHELNKILIENYILQVCKLSDPAFTRVPVEIAGKKHREKRNNLTVAHVNELLQAEGLLTPEIQAASAGIMRYREIVNDARNKQISHSDKETAMTYIELGAHTEVEALAFFDYLYKYVDAVGVAVGSGPLDFSVTSGPGDVADLFKALNGGEYPRD